MCVWEGGVRDACMAFGAKVRLSCAAQHGEQGREDMDKDEDEGEARTERRVVLAAAYPLRTGRVKVGCAEASSRAPERS